MKKVFIIIAVIGLAALFLVCGGSKEASRVEEDYYDLDSIFPEETSEPEQQVETYTPEPVRSEPETEPTREVVLYFEDINFEYDKYDLTYNAREILARHARLLKDNAQVQILIEGHCDERGTIEYNLALGDKRAAAVKEYLNNYGVNQTQLHTISYGKERPLDPRHTEDAWAKNRRAAFIILTR